METKKQYNFVLPQGFVLRGGKRDYVVEKVLGKGGFGVTYKVTGHIDVENIDFDAPFDVKEYFPDICSREADNATIKIPETKQPEVANGLKDFITEAQRLQETCKLNHNIVNVNEVFEANGTAYYVLEYLGGGDLRKKVKESPNQALSEQQMLDLMIPVGKAVQCLHEKNILHLDIKPDNIVMREGRKGAPDEPVLIDFGLATHFNTGGTPTSMTPSQGISAGYSPIEQYSLLRRFDPRLDVYAFSATCLYLLTGKDPAEALSMPAVFDDSMIPAGVSDRVRQAIKHGMSKEKDYRTSTMKQLLEQLQGEKGGETVPINVQPLTDVDKNKTKISSKKREEDKDGKYNFDARELPLNKDFSIKKFPLWKKILMALAALGVLIVIGTAIILAVEYYNDHSYSDNSINTSYDVPSEEYMESEATVSAASEAVEKSANDDYWGSAAEATENYDYEYESKPAVEEIYY